MNWHTRYLQQAVWTRDLRKYLFDQAGLTNASRVLEVGCGTGAILREIKSVASPHGLDLELDSLSICRIHAPAALLTRGDAHSLPYPDDSFDIVYCHFLLLWVKDPLQVLREMARVGRCVLAFAEPDYSQRVDEPAELKKLGKWQLDALIRQGADPSFGSRLAETFYQAGIQLIETGSIQSAEKRRSADEWENEWAVIQADLEGTVPGEEIQKMRILDENARRNGDRVLHVPTYFAWGKS
ncbi:MAG: methyltransferase domain-containing protein [Anaerolineales bacterium]|nr:methyltransferase domain-containing protein [Anaerolineales bacterium]